MPITDSDFSIAANGDIRWTGDSDTTYTVLELHRWLQDKADNASYSGDDILDITDRTPSERSTDNIITLNSPYNINDSASEHLYGGSITQNGGDEIYSGLRVLGAVNDPNTQIDIIQNNSVFQGDNPFWGDQSSGGFNGDAINGILMRCLIKSRTGGADIDGKRIRVQARQWGDTYDFFNVTLGQGEAVAAISTTPDAQNDTLRATVAAYNHVVNTEGFQTIDLNNGNGAREYYSKWTFDSDTSGDGLKAVWEYTKYITGHPDAGETIHGIAGELFLGVTHSWAYDNEAGGPFQENEILSWGTGATAGTGLLLALDDDGITGNMYIQLLTGVAPSNDLEVTGGTSSATCDVNGSVSIKTVPKHFLGSYTGTIIGAYGIGIDADDLTAQDTIQDLAGVIQVPPNNVTFTVTSVVSGEDYILVGPDSDGSLETDQLQLDSSAYAGGETLVRLSSNIPSDTPAAGSFRVFDGSSYAKVTYTSYDSAAFDGCSGMPAADSNANVFISYIDKVADANSVSFTTIYNANRNLFVRVRDGGGTPIKTFETSAVLGNAGGSVAAIRTTDV